MPWRGNRSAPPDPAEDVVYDDAGSGLFDACVDRFAGRGWTVTCDRQHSVWVRNEDGSHAVGLAPWLIRLQSIEQILDDVEEKMRVAGITTRV